MKITIKRQLFRILPTAILSSISFVLASCSTMQVQTGKDPQADLYKFHTYAWAPQVAPNPDKPPASLLDQTVISQVEKDLAQKGYAPALAGAKPDLLISYSAMAQDTVEYGAAMTPSHWGSYDQLYVVKKGSLTLQFIDPKANRVVWQGSAADVIGDSGATQKQVAEAVDAIMDKYPTAVG